MSKVVVGCAAAPWAGAAARASHRATPIAQRAQALPDHFADRTGRPGPKPSSTSAEAKAESSKSIRPDRGHPRKLFATSLMTLWVILIIYNYRAVARQC